MIRRVTTRGPGTTATAQPEHSRKIPAQWVAENGVGGQDAATTSLQARRLAARQHRGRSKIWVERTEYKQILDFCCHLSILGSATDLPQKACSVGGWKSDPSLLWNASASWRQRRCDDATMRHAPLRPMHCESPTRRAFDAIFRLPVLPRGAALFLRMPVDIQHFLQDNMGAVTVMRGRRRDARK
ncbi:hypothetical protein Vi05172_g1011 [Venturia inaequalis]|nr:hypothetical protein Vi05172_g1011 [Venturia inaequalis]